MVLGKAFASPKVKMLVPHGVNRVSGGRITTAVVTYRKTIRAVMLLMTVMMFILLLLSLLNNKGN